MDGDLSNQCEQSDNEVYSRDNSSTNKEDKNGSNQTSIRHSNKIPNPNNTEKNGTNGTSVSRGRPPKKQMPANQNEIRHLNLFTKNDETFHSAALVYTAKVFKDNTNLKRLSGFWIYEFLKDKSNYKNLNEIENKQYTKCPQQYQAFIKNCLSCGPKQVMREIAELLYNIYNLKQSFSNNQSNRENIEQIIRDKILEIYTTKTTLIGFNKEQHLVSLQLNDSKSKMVKREFEEYLKIIVNIALSVLKDQETNKYYDKVFNEGKVVDSSNTYKNQRKPKANSSNKTTPHTQDPGPKKKQKKS